MKTLFTNAEMTQALVEAKLPRKIAEAIPEVFSVAEIRPLVNDGDWHTIAENLSDVGEKRAKLIIDTLKGRLPEVVTIAADVAKPDLTMHEVPQLTLVYDDVRKDAKMKLEPERNKKRFGPALQKLQQLSREEEPAIFTTISRVDEDRKNPDKAVAMRSYWKNAPKGIKMKSGEFSPLVMPTNGLKDCVLTWARKELVNAVREWMACGARLAEVNIAKFEAYMGLLLPFTKQLVENKLTPKYEVLFEGFKNVHQSRNVLVKPDGSMHERTEHTVDEFDGQAWLDISDELADKLALTRAERRRLTRAINKFNGGTLRAPFQKGFLGTGFKMRQCLKDEGVTEIDGRSVDDYAIFGDISVFKAAIGETGLYEKFEDYCANFTKLNHRFGILLENHGLKQTFLPAQQLQAAHGGDLNFVREGAKEEVAYLKKATDPTVAAARYTPKPLAKIAQADPSVMNTWFATELANNGYKKEYTHAKSGRTHNNSVGGFVVKDPVAQAQWIAHLLGARTELPTGCIKANTVFAPAAGFVGEAVASRNPVIGNYGLMVVDVIDSVGKYDKYFEEGFDVIAVSIWDDLCKRARLDHDGDKLRLTYVKWFVDLVKSIDYTGFADWETFGKALKCVPTYENTVEFFGGMTNTSTLGLNVDMSERMISNGVATEAIHEMVMDYFMNKGTDVKQGANGNTIEGEVGKIWYEMVEGIKDKKMCRSQMEGKLLKGRQVDMDKVEDEWCDNPCDIIGKAVSENAPSALAFDGKFDVDNLFWHRRRIIPELAHKKILDKETGEWKGGFFDELVGRNDKEWKAVMSMEQAPDWQQFQAWQKAEALKELYAFGAEQGYSEHDVYDAITTYVFVKLDERWNKANETLANSKDSESLERAKNTKSWLMVLARTYLAWFGDQMEEAYCYNTSMELGDVPEGVDLSDDVDLF